MQGSTTATKIFGLSWSQLHWIVGVSAETLAVTIPAVIALGAGLDVAASGGLQRCQPHDRPVDRSGVHGRHINTTMGKALGLKDALQSAQDAANPGVYELLGSAVNDAKAGMGQLAVAGLQVVHMWDEFAARITVDMQSMQKSGEAQSLLGNMVSDLQELGQVFGNVGHAILNFAADMPGLAEVLLKIVDGISGVILWLSKMPSWADHRGDGPGGVLPLGWSGRFDHRADRAAAADDRARGHRGCRGGSGRGSRGSWSPSRGRGPAGVRAGEDGRGHRGRGHPVVGALSGELTGCRKTCPRRLGTPR